MSESAAYLPRFQWGKGIWRGRGTIKVFLRSAVNEVAPFYWRLRRRNPVDHKLVRIRRLEVWW